MPTLKITDLRVWNQRGEDATLFRYFQDAISFAVGVELSPDLTKNLTTKYHADFQVIEAVTNQIVVNSVQVYQLPEDWPLWWLTAGNNWSSPYTTADVWGLDEFDEPAIFGFRGILTASYWDTLGQHQVDAFDVSSIRWFQIDRQFTL